MSRNFAKAAYGPRPPSAAANQKAQRQADALGPVKIDRLFLGLLLAVITKMIIAAAWHTKMFRNAYVEFGYFSSALSAEAATSSAAPPSRLSLGLAAMVVQCLVGNVLFAAAPSLAMRQFIVIGIGVFEWSFSVLSVAATLKPAPGAELYIFILLETVFVVTVVVVLALLMFVVHPDPAETREDDDEAGLKQD